ncbi:MAG: molybdopterin molybdotransferase MoeA [Desulforhopalus sp.]
MNESSKTRDMLGRGELTGVARALTILLDALQSNSPKTETVPLAQGLDRVLAAPIHAPEDLPAWARSTMDGFAVQASDTFGASESMPCYLNISGEVQMGKTPPGSVQKGCCYKIPTGGLLPEKSDSVVMFEHTVPVDETMIEIVKSVGAGANLIQRGEDISTGALALDAGHRLRPQDIGLLAGLGIGEIVVTRQLQVGILSTGDEIVAHTKQPAPGQIRNINTLALACQVQRAGARYRDYGIVSDSKEIFLAAVKKAVSDNDIVLFSGGSSVGVRDLGEQVIEELGPPGILVHGVTLKPGKPVLIGLSGTTPIFGLPGHPVSAMVCFDFFVKPAIKKLSGMAFSSLPSPAVSARLTRNINSAAGRLDVIRVRLDKRDDQWYAEPVLGKSGSISTLSRAHGYFLIDEQSQGVNENSVIEVYLFL